MFFIYKGPLTLTDENSETTLIGIITGDGDPEDVKKCYRSSAMGRVSNPNILNWIKQQIAEV